MAAALKGNLKIHVPEGFDQIEYRREARKVIRRIIRFQSLEGVDYGRTLHSLLYNELRQHYYALPALGYDEEAAEVEKWLWDQEIARHLEPNNYRSAASREDPILVCAVGIQNGQWRFPAAIFIDAPKELALKVDRLREYPDAYDAIKYLDAAPDDGDRIMMLVDWLLEHDQEELAQAYQRYLDELWVPFKIPTDQPISAGASRDPQRENG